MHSKRPDVVTEHSKQSSERTCATALWEQPGKQVEQPVQQCNSHTLSPPTPRHGKCVRAAFLQALAALVPKSSGVLMLLLPGSPVLTRALRPCPGPRGQPRHRPGPLRCGRSEDGAETSPGSFSSAAAVHRRLFTPLCPSTARRGPCIGLWVQRWHCGLWHTGTMSELFRTPRGRSCGCCSRARG